ncbi:MAG: RNA polymerase sigma factor [Rudaea sp.]
MDRLSSIQSSGSVDPVAPSQDLDLVAALRRGDESAFGQLIERYQNSMLRIARLYISDSVVAEEVVQETWLGVLQGLARFEGRSSLKTWIFRILVNQAKTRAVRERRSMPFSAFGQVEETDDEPAVDPDRFLPPGSEYAGGWKSFPADWTAIPEERLLAAETMAIVREAIRAMAPVQREVITLRDIEGWTSEEVCNVLELGETNQRVLLHRARSKVRRALERYFQ